MILGDGMIGQMMEPVELQSKGQLPEKTGYVGQGERT